jgi:hypothetical protein
MDYRMAPDEVSTNHTLPPPKRGCRESRHNDSRALPTATRFSLPPTPALNVEQNRFQGKWQSRNMRKSLPFIFPFSGTTSAALIGVLRCFFPFPLGRSFIAACRHADQSFLDEKTCGQCDQRAQEQDEEGLPVSIDGERRADSSMAFQNGAQEGLQDGASRKREEIEQPEAGSGNPGGKEFPRAGESYHGDCAGKNA